MGTPVETKYGFTKDPYLPYLPYKLRLLKDFAVYLYYSQSDSIRYLHSRIFKPTCGFNEQKINFRREIYSNQYDEYFKDFDIYDLENNKVRIVLLGNYNSNGYFTLRFPIFEAEINNYKISNINFISYFYDRISESPGLPIKIIMSLKDENNISIFYLAEQVIYAASYNIPNKRIYSRFLKSGDFSNVYSGHFKELIFDGENYYVCGTKESLVLNSSGELYKVNHSEDYSINSYSDQIIRPTYLLPKGHYLYDSKNGYLYDLINRSIINIPIYKDRTSHFSSNRSIVRSITENYIFVNQGGLIDNVKDELRSSRGYFFEYDTQGNLIKIFRYNNDRGYSLLQPDSNGNLSYNAEHNIANLDLSNVIIFQPQEPPGNFTFIENLESLPETNAQEADYTFYSNIADVVNYDTEMRYNLFFPYKTLSITSPLANDHIILTKPVSVSWKDFYTDLVSYDNVNLLTLTRHLNFSVPYDNKSFVFPVGSFIGVDEVILSLSCNSEELDIDNIYLSSQSNSGFFSFFC